MEDSLLYFMINVIDGFINKVAYNFTTLWSGFYGLCLFATSCFFAMFGFQYMIGKLDGETMKKKLYQFALFLVMYIAGFTLIPEVQNIGLYINKLLKENVIFAGKNEIKARNFEGEATSMKDLLVKKGIQEKRESEFKILSAIEIKKLEQIKDESGSDKTSTSTKKDKFGNVIPYLPPVDVSSTGDNAGNYVPALDDVVLTSLEKPNDPKEASFWSMGLFSILGWILEMISVILVTIILFMKGVMTLVYRASFPIVMCLSLLPGKEKLIKDWWDGFYTLIMMNVTILLIETILAIGTHTLQTAINDDPLGPGVLLDGLIYPLLMFVGGVLYLGSPSITTAIFGGNNAVSQAMTSSIQTATLLGAGVAHLFKKDKKNDSGGGTGGGTAGGTVDVTGGGTGSGTGGGNAGV